MSTDQAFVYVEIEGPSYQRNIPIAQPEIWVSGWQRWQEFKLDRTFCVTIGAEVVHVSWKTVKVKPTRVVSQCPRGILLL